MDIDNYGMIIGRATATVTNTYGISKYSRWVFLGETEYSIRHNVRYAIHQPYLNIHLDIEWKYDEFQRELYFQAFPEYRIDSNCVVDFDLIEFNFG